MARLLRHFRHQHDVGRRIDVGKRGRVLVQLVSQHEYEVAAAFHGLQLVDHPGTDSPASFRSSRARSLESIFRNSTTVEIKPTSMGTLAN